MPLVNVDNYAGVRLAVEHVLGLGHRRIAFVQGGRTGDGLERREAFLAALWEWRISVPERFLVIVTNEFLAAADAVETLLRGSAPRRRRVTGKPLEPPVTSSVAVPLRCAIASPPRQPVLLQ
jgi:DNA-binding LacI/PurR family transcriptional regulator